jgi:hypothetical protein
MQRNAVMIELHYSLSQQKKEQQQKAPVKVMK